MCSGYICHFEDLQVTSVLLDEIMKVCERLQRRLTVCEFVGL